MSKRGRHKSAAPDLNRSLKWLESKSEVQKLILGFTENCRHKYTPGHIRCKSEVKGGLKVNGYFGGGVIDIFLHVEPEHVESVKQLIKERFE